MGNTNTLRVIATVKNEEAISNWPSLSFPCVTVSLPLSLIPREEAVPPCLAVPCPVPARVRFLDLLPESFLCRTVLVNSFARSRAENGFIKTPNAELWIKPVFSAALRAASCFLSRLVAFEFACVITKLLRRFISTVKHKLFTASEASVKKWHGEILVQDGRNVNNVALGA